MRIPILLLYLSKRGRILRSGCISFQFCYALISWRDSVVMLLYLSERKEIWKISDEIVRTSNITQTAIGNKNGLWTSVIAAAVFAVPPLPLSF